MLLRSDSVSLVLRQGAHVIATAKRTLRENYQSHHARSQDVIDKIRQMSKDITAFVDLARELNAVLGVDVWLDEVGEVKEQ